MCLIMGRSCRGKPWTARGAAASCFQRGINRGCREIHGSGSIIEQQFELHGRQQSVADIGNARIDRPVSL
jgi:hypothetical protein